MPPPAPRSRVSPRWRHTSSLACDRSAGPGAASRTSCPPNTVRWMEGSPAGEPARPRTAQEWLIESRLTPNAISMTGLVLNLTAAGLVLAEHFLLAGIAFIVG